MPVDKNLKKIVFLDRDGVINKKAAEHEYITSIDDFIVNESLFSMIEPYKKEGYEFIVITNQRCIARGILTEKKLAEIHKYMKGELKKNDVEILDIFHCPHDSNSCDCRKPKPGMLVSAFAKYPIDLESSVLIGDSESDFELGVNYGIKKTILVKSDTNIILKTR